MRLSQVEQARPSPSAQYPSDRWRPANNSPAFRMQESGDRISVVSEERRWSYCLEYGPLQAPAAGTYDFAVVYELIGGGVMLGVLSWGKQRWLPSSTEETVTGEHRMLTLSIRLGAGETFWLVLTNNHPGGDGVSRFVVTSLTGSVEYSNLVPAPLKGIERWRPTFVERRRWMVEKATDLSVIPMGLARVALRASIGGIRRLRNVRGVGRLVRAADRIAPVALRRLRDARRSRIVHNAPEYAAAQSARAALEAELQSARAAVQTARTALEAEIQSALDQARRLTPLTELDDVYNFLKDRRPDDLHLNACGDFQLMAREHWFELRGYPEFHAYSMNIDGLLGTIAHYAGIKECALRPPCCIFHLEHEVGSGWSPEGEALLRRRMAEREITWVDARVVFLWGAYMHWLRRPMIFNTSDWGFGAYTLAESVVRPRADGSPTPLRNSREERL